MLTAVLSVLTYVGVAVSGFLLNEIINKVFKLFSTSQKRITVKKKTNHLSDEPVKDIHVVEEIVPYAKSRNIRTKLLPEKALYINMGETSTIPARLVDGFAKLFNIESNEAKRHIEEARKEVAEQFANRLDGNFFNGRLFGIVKSDALSRTEDPAEDPILYMDLYPTDYFTHKVIERLLYNQQLSIGTLENKIVPDTAMCWSRTSLGLSIIVVLRNSNQIILTRRSKKTSYSEGSEWIYVSATETVSETDERNGIVDLEDALLRGIKEELGIDSEMCYTSTIKFYDHFYETHFCQDNIVASIELDEKYSFFDVQKLKAKDKQLEVNSSFVISNSEHAINEFIKENEANMRSQTIYSLKVYASRLAYKE